MLYRIAHKSQIHHVKQWESENIEEYDSATKGSSALVAALVRNLRAELAFFNNCQSIAIFNDYMKFFDTIDLKVLKQCCMQLEYPCRLASLALQQHTAPRVLKCSGYVGKPIKINRSILAGCTHSVPFTRVLLKKPMRNLVDEHDRIHVGLFVDDTTFQTIGFSWGKMSNRMIPLVLQFFEQVKKLNLKLSPKATIVTTSKACSKFLQKECAKAGITFRTSSETRDLGITYTAALLSLIHI